MSLRVRAMTSQDIDEVVKLAARFVEAPHWTRRDYEQMPPPAPPAGPRTAPRTAPPAASPPTPLTRCSVVALSDNNLAGFAVASCLRMEPAEIEGLVVDERYRRQGIGSALIRACKEWAANAGALNIRLEVRASNAAALALYQRHGFSAVGHRRAYYSAPIEDAMLLQAPLGAQETT
jgi:[ribosomal protein S18]-alanine N-acetyltransferase